jgi:hypothetical protein
MQIYNSLYPYKQYATGYTQAKTPSSLIKNKMGELQISMASIIIAAGGSIQKQEDSLCARREGPVVSLYATSSAPPCGGA